MTRNGNARWALSFADLCLLLLGFFVIMHAQAGNRLEVTRSLRSSFGGETEARALPGETAYRADTLFEPGEAVLRADARLALRRTADAALASDQQVRVTSEGVDPGARRFDRWELAAARTAAVGRALAAGGLPEGRIVIAMQPTNGAVGEKQTIAVLRFR